MLDPIFANKNGKKYRLAYSKKVSANGDNQPIVGSEPLSNNDQPCFGLERGKLIIDETAYAEIFLPFEKPISTQPKGCQIFEWRKESLTQEKTRFTNSLLSINLFDLEDENTVYEQL